MTKRKVLVTIADGTEEMEAVIIIDILRRAQADVRVASVDSIEVTASRGVTIKADCLISNCTGEIFDLIVLPGGMPGAEHLRDSTALRSMLSKQKDENRMYAAICASPAVVLHHHNLLEGHRATCHPSFKKDIPIRIYSDSNVVADGNCVTSKGPGTAIEFALKLVELLFDPQTAKSVATAMCL